MPAKQSAGTSRSPDAANLKNWFTELGPIEPVGARPRQRGRALTRKARLRAYVDELERGGPLPLVTIVEGSRARLRAAESLARATVAHAVVRSWPT